MTTFTRSLLFAVATLLLVAPNVAFPQAEEIVLDLFLGDIDENGQTRPGAIYAFCGRNETVRVRSSGLARLFMDMPFARALRLELMRNQFFSSDGATVTIDVFSIDGGPAFEDFGSGTLYGSKVVARSDPRLIVIELSAEAVAAFNSVRRRTCLPDGEGGWYCFADLFRIGLAAREPLVSFPLGVNFVDEAHRLVVTPLPLPVESKTWGGIKAMYRH